MWLFHTHRGLRTSLHFLCWFLFGTSCVGGESDRSATQKHGLWPAAECWGCLPRLSEWPAHLWGQPGIWVQGGERNWSGFPALKWRISHNEEAPDQRPPNDKKGDSNSPGRAGAPVARWGEDARLWMGTFVSAPFDNKKHLKQLEPAIYKSDRPNAIVLKIDMHQNHWGKFLEIRIPGLLSQRL